jgi:hypothetical protein
MRPPPTTVSTSRGPITDTTLRSHRHIIRSRAYNRPYQPLTHLFQSNLTQSPWVKKLKSADTTLHHQPENKTTNTRCHRLDRGPNFSFRLNSTVFRHIDPSSLPQVGVVIPATTPHREIRRIVERVSALPKMASILEVGPLQRRMSFHAAGARLDDGAGTREICSRKKKTC